MTGGLVALIQANLRSVMDKQRFQEAVDIMEKGRTELKKIAAGYKKAVAAVNDVDIPEEE